MPLAVKRSVLFIFFLALGIRTFNLDIPFIEPFNNYSRQSMCASVARNLYEHGFNLFYPEIDENGSGPSLYNVEMPIYSYLMAVGYKLTGAVREGVARSVSVFFSIGFLFFLYQFVKRVKSESAAFWAVGFAAVSPMVVALSRSIQPDITMLFAVTGALYFFYRYRETSETRFILASAGLFLFAVLTRVFALYLFLPIIYLAWEKDGWRMFGRPVYYLYAFFVSTGLLWYFYMWWVGRHEELCYQPYCYSPATETLRLIDFFRPENLKLPAKAFFLHLLMLPGTVLFLIGLFRQNKQNRLFLVWLLSTTLYLILIWRTAVIHPYYFLPLAGPCAFYIAQGVEMIRTGDGRVFEWLRQPFCMIIFTALIVLNTAYYYRLLYFIPNERMAVVEAGKRVDTLVPPGAFVIAAYGASPIQVYYTHRRGWVFDLAEKDGKLIGNFEKWQAKGATHFMTTELTLLAQRPEFLKYLSRYPILEKSESYVIYDLKEGAR